MTSQPAPSSGILDLFEERVQEIWVRDELPVADIHGVARLVRLLIESGGVGSAAVAHVMESSGIRRLWNDCLRIDRARQIAAWIGPFLVPPVVDVLGGDFSLLSEVVAQGIPIDQVVGCERASAYGQEATTRDVPFVCHDVGEEMALPVAQGGTALICAVLHHEPSPKALLDSVVATGAESWLVIENCIDDQNDEEFHLFVDEFFNRGLNQFNIPCVPEHRTAEGWRHLLSQYGSVVYEETLNGIAGIPFPYTLFHVNRA